MSVTPVSYAELGLSTERLLEFHHLMSLTRAISQFSWVAARQGKVHFTMMQDGNEASSLGSAMALREGVDFILPYARDLGAVLAMGMTTREVMLNLLGKAEDPSGGGRNLPFHFGSRRLRIVSLASPVGLPAPIAMGIALASKLRSEDQVTLCYFGDGGASKGDVHEGMNFAAVFKVPVVFLCSNNAWAISVPAERQAAVKDLSLRAQGYGMPGGTVDGTDVLEVYQATKEAVERARSGEGPTFIEAKTVRLAPHTSSDDQLRYRTEEDLEADRARDPVPRFRNRLLEEGVLDEATDEGLQAQIKQEIAEAWDWAQSRPEPESTSALEHVYAPDD